MVVVVLLSRMVAASKMACFVCSNSTHCMLVFDTPSLNVSSLIRCVR